MTAQDAIATKDQTTLNEQTTRLEKIKSDQRQALIDLHTAITQAPKLIAAQIDPTSAQAIYDELSKLDPADHQAAIEALSSRLGVSPLSIVSGLQSIIGTDDTKKLDTQAKKLSIARDEQLLSQGGSGGAGTFKLTNTDTGKLQGVGLTSAEIKAIQSDINTKGATAVLANPQLTTEQQTAIKNILTPPNSADALVNAIQNLNIGGN